jgi:hypothetical protein
MKKMMLAVAVLFATASNAFAQLKAPSTWTNEGNSVLTITAIDADGKIHGTFVNHKAGYGCQGTPYTVKGNSGPATRPYFTVTFTECSTVTIWHFKVQGKKMKAPWTLQYVGSDGKFHSMLATDNFTATSP